MRCSSHIHRINHEKTESCDQSMRETVVVQNPMCVSNSGLKKTNCAQDEKTYSYTSNSMILHEFFTNRFAQLFGAHLRVLLQHSVAEELSWDIAGQELDEYQIDLFNK